MNEQIKYIGVCTSVLRYEDRFFLISQLNHYAVRAGYRLLVFDVHNDLYNSNNPYDDAESAVFRLIPFEKLTTLVVFSEFIRRDDILSKIINDAQNASVPVFSLNREWEGCTSFYFDYAESFADICRHVIEHHGAKHIYMMSGNVNNSFSDIRIDAFLKIAAENGLKPEDILVGHGDFWDGAAVTQMKKWIEEENRPIPEAVICANDLMAIGVSTYLQKIGVRVPQDCIVTGFDGILQSEHHVPRLTTCRENYGEMAEHIITAIQHVSQGLPVEASYHVGFELRISESCGCKPLSTAKLNTNKLDLYKKLMDSFECHDQICEAQHLVQKSSTVKQLAEQIVLTFKLPTVAIALNKDMFSEPDYECKRDESEAFTDEMRFVVNRKSYYNRPETFIPRSQLLPDWNFIDESENPTIILTIHQADFILGYCVFQPDVDISAYENLHSFASTVGSALGIYRDRKRIEFINNRLLDANKELEFMYAHDHLTGLYNRRGFYHICNKMINDPSHKAMTLLIISADMDGLKKINDTYGHQEGDSAIQTAAKALADNAEGCHACARFGGDEYVVCFIVSENEAAACFEKYRQDIYSYLSQYNATSGKPYNVEMSLGFCMAEVGSVDLDDLIREADDKMYNDKVSRGKQRK